MKKERHHISLLMWSGVFVLVALLAMCSAIFYVSLERQLYEGRKDHLTELSIKISEIINTEMGVLQTKADAAENLMNVGSTKTYSSTAEWLEGVRSVLSIDNGVVVAVNEKSTFYTSSGYYARWSTPEDLTVDSNVPMIRELTFHGSKDTYLVFMRSLESGAAFDEDGNELTHIMVAIPLANLEDELTVTGYGDNIFTYMVNSSGRRLYKQTFGSSFIEEFNVLTAIKDYEFSEPDAHDLLESAIRERTSECTEFKIPDTKERFFIAVVPIEDTDWSLLVFVPTDVLGESSNSILANLRTYMIVLVLLIVGIISLILAWSYHRSLAKQLKEQQDETVRMLEDAANEADRENLAKMRFLGRMTHDIRVPISRIVSTVGAARHKTKDQKTMTPYLRQISRASDYLLSMIGDLLEMSRIESGRVSLRRKPVNIRTVAESCCMLVNGRKDEHKITFKAELDELSHVMVFGDEQKLHQIMVHILGNAIKFTPEGGSVKFRMQETDCTDRTISIRFEVEDTGIGMSEEFTDHLFEPFSQEVSDNEDKFPGVGLGMAITKKYVELMGGRIQATSISGSGTRIRIELSFDVFDEDELLAGQTTPNLRGMSVLLVEDEEESRNAITNILKEAGVRVITAVDGEQGTAIFEDSAYDSFDAILMDVMLPKKNGYEAALDIRGGAHPKGESIPIVALVASTYTEKYAAVFSCSMNALVPKPVDRRYLFEVLGQYYRAE